MTKMPVVEMPVVMVPGLRGPAPGHWQELLATELDGVVQLPRDRGPLQLDARADDLDACLAELTAPALVVAHSAGVLTLVHWASRTERSDQVGQVLLVTPPMLHEELPSKYPSLSEMAQAGWSPVPRDPLPWPTVVVTSENDPLGPAGLVEAAAADWKATVLPGGPIGHANPDAGFGDWPWMRALVSDLRTGRGVT